MSMANEGLVPVTGFAWSDNIGWIQFNHGKLNPVMYDKETGELSGYAWSPNIGWIKFDGLSADDLGIGGSSAKVDDSTSATGNVLGWMRACAGAIPDDCSDMNSRTDGWGGWIKMSGEVIPAPGSYNVTIREMNETDSGKRDFHGYAWGSDVVGWVSFNCKEGGPGGADICGKSNYKVQIDFGSNQSSSSSSSSTNNPKKLIVSCLPDYSEQVIGKKVKFTAKIENSNVATKPFFYQWIGIKDSPFTNKKNSKTNSETKVYNTEGSKEDVNVIVTDNIGFKSDIVSCPVKINKENNSSSKPTVKIIEI